MKLLLTLLVASVLTLPAQADEHVQGTLAGFVDASSAAGLSKTLHRPEPAFIKGTYLTQETWGEILADLEAFSLKDPKVTKDLCPDEKTCPNLNHVHTTPELNTDACKFNEPLAEQPYACYLGLRFLLDAFPEQKTR